MKTLYQILEVPSTASKEDIKKAYKRLSFKFHPDRNNGEEFYEERIKELNYAYTILSNDYKKSAYDNKIRAEEEALQALRRKKEEDASRKKREEFQKANFASGYNTKKSDSNTQARPNVPPKQTSYNSSKQTQSNSRTNKTNAKESNNNALYVGISILGFLVIVTLFFVSPSNKDYVVKQPDLFPDTPTKQYSPIHHKQKKKNHNKSKANVLTDSSSFPQNTDTEIDSQKNIVPTIIYTKSTVHDTTSKSIAKKPKWYQFKKLKAWKRKKNEINKGY